MADSGKASITVNLIEEFVRRGMRAQAAVSVALERASRRIPRQGSPRPNSKSKRKRR